MTAVDTVDAERIDHQGFVPEIWAGLLLTSLYVMQIGPSILNLSDYLEDVLSLLLFVGTVTCLTGVVIGTKWFFKKARRKVSYVLELIGLPLIIAALAGYTYASVEMEPMLIGALAGGLGLTIEIGSVRMIVDLVGELTNDDRN